VKTQCLETDQLAYWRHVGAERLVHGIPSLEMPMRVRAEQARKRTAYMFSLQIRMLILEPAGPCGGRMAGSWRDEIFGENDGRVQGLGTRHAGPAGWFLHVGGYLAQVVESGLIGCFFFILLRRFDCFSCICSLPSHLRLCNLG
jgi:hypothetical protein